MSTWTDQHRGLAGGGAKTPETETVHSDTNDSYYTDQESVHTGGGSEERHVTRTHKFEGRDENETQAPTNPFFALEDVETEQAKQNDTRKDYQP